MDTSGNTVTLGPLEALPERRAMAMDLTISGPDGLPVVESVIVWRDGHDVRAWLNVCPHAGRRLEWAPGQFLLKGQTLICAVHGASFDMTDGSCIAGPCKGDRLRVVALQVINGVVCLAN